MHSEKCMSQAILSTDRNIVMFQYFLPAFIARVNRDIFPFRSVIIRLEKQLIVWCFSDSFSVFCEVFFYSTKDSNTLIIAMFCIFYTFLDIMRYATD